MSDPIRRYSNITVEQRHRMDRIKHDLDEIPVLPELPFPIDPEDRMEPDAAVEPDDTPEP